METDISSVEEDDFELEVLEEDNDDVEIDIIDDRPEEDQVEPRDPSKATKTDFEDESLDDKFDDETNGKRLNRARYEYNEERRQKEEAIRIQDEAIAFASSVREENERLKKLVHSGEGVLLETMTSRAESDIQMAERILKQAYDSEDSEALIAAQKALNKAQIDADRASSYRQAPIESSPEFKPSASPGQEAAADPVLAAWMSDNEWFNKDEKLTKIAMAEHGRIVSSGGTVGDAEYYEKIDRLISRFNKGGTAEPGRRSKSVVAPGTRNQSGVGGKSNRKVVLTASEAKVADKLGVPRKAYAEAKLLREQRENG